MKTPALKPVAARPLNLKSLSVLAVSLALLTGCGTVGSNYSGPARTYPAQWEWNQGTQLDFTYASEWEWGGNAILR